MLTHATTLTSPPPPPAKKSCMELWCVCVCVRVCERLVASLCVCVRTCVCKPGRVCVAARLTFLEHRFLLDPLLLRVPAAGTVLTIYIIIHVASHVRTWKLRMRPTSWGQCRASALTQGTAVKGRCLHRGELHAREVCTFNLFLEPLCACAADSAGNYKRL